MRGRILIITLVCISLFSGVQNVQAQFERGKISLGAQAAYTLPTKEFNNWFDGTYQAGGRLNIGLSQKSDLELALDYGKFDTDKSKTTGTPGTWNYSFNHYYQYARFSLNWLYAPSALQGAGFNTFTILGVSLSRWEYERDAYNFTGWDFEDEAQLTDIAIKKLNRNGYEHGINIGYGVMFGAGGPVCFDLRLQYEASPSSQWAQLLVDMEQVDIVQFIGVKAGVRFDISK